MSVNLTEKHINNRYKESRRNSVRAKWLEQVRARTPNKKWKRLSTDMSTTKEPVKAFINWYG